MRHENMLTQNMTWSTICWTSSSGISWWKRCLLVSLSHVKCSHEKHFLATNICSELALVPLCFLFSFFIFFSLFFLFLFFLFLFNVRDITPQHNKHTTSLYCYLIMSNYTNIATFYFFCILFECFTVFTINF